MKTKALLSTLSVAFLLAAPAFAGTDHPHGTHTSTHASHAEGLTKVASGIKGTLKVDPGKSMIDLYLYDSKTGKPIKEAKVRVKAKLPDGKIVEKELMGMKMGTGYSFMNTLDMSLEGDYTFDIAVEAGGATALFDFAYTRK